MPFVLSLLKWRLTKICEFELKIKQIFKSDFSIKMYCRYYLLFISAKFRVLNEQNLIFFLVILLIIFRPQSLSNAFCLLFCYSPSVVNCGVHMTVFKAAQKTDRGQMVLIVVKITGVNEDNVW